MTQTMSKTWEQAEKAFNKPKETASDAILDQMEQDRLDRAERTRVLRALRLAKAAPARGKKE
jgi:hypothetical protein